MARRGRFLSLRRGRVACFSFVRLGGLARAGARHEREPDRDFQASEALSIRGSLMSRIRIMVTPWTGRLSYETSTWLARYIAICPEVCNHFPASHEGFPLHSGRSLHVTLRYTTPAEAVA